MKATEMGWQDSSAINGIQHHARPGKDMNEVCTTSHIPIETQMDSASLGFQIDYFSLDIYIIKCLFHSTILCKITSYSGMKRKFC